MLTKLIKYEFKSTSRIMWFLYGALIVVGGLLGLTLRVNSDIFNPYYSYSETSNTVFSILFGSLTLIYILMLQAVVIMTAIMIITRFNKNLLGDEGYLMHVLPVKTHQLITSKIVIAMLWGVIAAVSAFFSIILLSITSGFMGFLFEEYSLTEILDWIVHGFTLDTFLFIVMLILVSITSILEFYFAMAVGNLANKNKFLYAVLTYIGIQVILSILTTILAFNSGGSLVEVLIYEDTMQPYLINTIIQSLVLGSGLFYGTNYILKNKLNLA